MLCNIKTTKIRTSNYTSCPLCKYKISYDSDNCYHENQNFIFIIEAIKFYKGKAINITMSINKLKKLYVLRLYYIIL